MTYALPGQWVLSGHSLTHSVTTPTQNQFTSIYSNLNPSGEGEFVT